MDKALKKLNEEKNIINSDIDMIRFAFYDGNCKFNEFPLCSEMTFAQTRTLGETRTAFSPTNWTSWSKNKQGSFTQLQFHQTLHFYN